jgi:hypothetical protein
MSNVDGVFDERIGVGNWVRTRQGRGKITDISLTAEKWPYSVEFSDGREDLFAARELTVIHEPKNLEALEALEEMIAEMEKQLRVLKFARDTLDGEPMNGFAKLTTKEQTDD